MIKELLLVALGGALGSLTRHGCTLCIAQFHGHPTLATLLVNVVGSFLIGLLLASGCRSEWNRFAVVGFCGGFTTFSTFSSQSVTLLQQSSLWPAFSYIGASLIFCLTATWLGLLIGNRIKLHTL